MKTTIKALSEAIGMSRFTLAQAARNGLLRESAEQSGNIWLVDDSHEDFKKWLQEHEQQSRVKGRKKKQAE